MLLQICLAVFDEVTADLITTVCFAWQKLNIRRYQGRIQRELRGLKPKFLLYSDYSTLNSTGTKESTDLSLKHQSLQKLYATGTRARVTN